MCDDVDESESDGHSRDSVRCWRKAVEEECEAYVVIRRTRKRTSCWRQVGKER